MAQIYLTHFIRFLLEKNCYCQYLKNTFAHYRYMGNSPIRLLDEGEYDLLTILKDMEPTKYIFRAFPWREDDTIRWSAIHRAWSNFVIELESQK